MKTFNKKFICLFSTTLILTGCMPDSLTKYKKDPPKKGASSSSTTASAPTSVPNGSGGTVSLPSIVDPTFFDYADDNDLVFESKVTQTFKISGDNAFSNEDTRNSLIKNCTISPSLPAGLSINNTTCDITGNYSQPFTDTSTFNIVNKGKKDFVVTVSFFNKDGGTSTLNTAVKLQVLEKPSLLLYSQSSKVLLKVAGNLSTFNTSSGDIITSDGKSPSNVGKNTIYGTVETADLTNSLLGVNNVKNYNYQGSTTLFTDSNSDYQPDTNSTYPQYYFTVGDVVDSDDTFYVERAKIEEIRNVFPVYAVAPSTANMPYLQPLNIGDSGISVNNTTSSRNYVEFTVSPKLPTGFTLDPLTGKISGYSTVPVAMTTYQITASNLLGAIKYDLQLEVAAAPTQLFITRSQLLTVNSLTYSYLKEGDMIVSPISGMIPSVHGIITKMIPATKQLEVLTLDGSFAKDTQLDVGKTFNAMIGTVLSTPVNFNAALTTAAPVTIPVGGVAVGNMYAHNLTASPLVSSRVYVTATDAAVIQSGATFLTSTISEIDAESLKLHMTTDPAGNLTGLDILSTTARAYGYVYEDAGSDIYVSSIFRSVNNSDSISRSFRHGDSLKFDERATNAGATATLGSSSGDIAFDHYLFFERGVFSQYSAGVITGSGITYSITPTLPAGITLDPKTGILSGTATTRTENKNYVISAKNLLGESLVNLRIEVRDYFSLTETSGAPSFKLHKVGDYQNPTSCRVNASDIYNETGHRDIRCFMDGEEQDIHSFGLKLKATVGPGVCKFVSIDPYHFWKWSPKRTNGTVVRWTNANTTLASDRAITSEEDCEGNYTNEGGPNCDEGSITIHSYSYDPTAPIPESFAGTQILSCGGKRSNCIDGPIRDILSSTSIDSGMRGLISSSDSGYDNSWTFTSPISHGDYTNLRIANNTFTDFTTGGSKCSAHATDVNDYTDLSLVLPIPSTPYPVILDTTGAFYTAGTDTDYYGTSYFETNGEPRGKFVTANNARSVKPYKKIKVDSKLGPFDGAYPYYQVSCLDAAKESVATINVVVRDWNQKFKLQNEIDKEVPDEALAAIPLPILMRATGGTVVNPVNDFDDWNDNYTLYLPERDDNAPDYAACGTRPTYTPPAAKAAVPGMIYPAADEFQFPEAGL